LAGSGSPIARAAACLLIGWHRVTRRRLWVHQSRISAKRLRSLLDPLDERLAGAEAVAQLPTLDQRLGEIREARHRPFAALGVSAEEEGDEEALSASARA
jgi:CHAD domain-containing protein